MEIAKHNREVEFSIVILCYNEEEALPVSIPPLLEACEALDTTYELVLVNNGSWDTTPDLIDGFARQGYPIRRVDVPVNRGFGWGAICGLGEAKGEYIGYMCADGQILPNDVIRTYEAIRNTEAGTMAKVRRVTRDDGKLRRTMSWFYNTLFSMMYGTITPDVNGTPKVFHCEDLEALRPTSMDGFIETELMVKAKTLGLKIIEVPVAFQKRQGGKSAVQALRTSFEFLMNLLRFRQRKDFQDWCRELNSPGGRRNG